MTLLQFIILNESSKLGGGSYESWKTIWEWGKGVITEKREILVGLYPLWCSPAQKIKKQKFSFFNRRVHYCDLSKN
jgi:hypothetical protein